MLARARRPQRGLPHHGGEIGDDETRCALRDVVELQVAGGDAAQQGFQERLARRTVGQAQPQLAVAQIGGAHAGVHVVGHGGRRDERHPRRGDRGVQFAEDECGNGFRGGGQQRVDVGDEEYPAAVAECGDG